LEGGVVGVGKGGERGESKKKCKKTSQPGKGFSGFLQGMRGVWPGLLVDFGRGTNGGRGKKGLSPKGNVGLGKKKWGHGGEEHPRKEIGAAGFLWGPKTSYSKGTSKPW